MDTENYCKTLDNLDRNKAIQAIHQAYLQLKAVNDFDDGQGYVYFDNKPALKQLKDCLKEAGHIGFND